MAPGFSISEYDMGCEAQIEGGARRSRPPRGLRSRRALRRHHLAAEGGRQRNGTGELPGRRLRPLSQLRRQGQLGRRHDGVRDHERRSRHVGLRVHELHPGGGGRCRGGQQARKPHDSDDHDRQRAVSHDGEPLPSGRRHHRCDRCIRRPVGRPKCRQLHAQLHDARDERDDDRAGSSSLGKPSASHASVRRVWPKARSRTGHPSARRARE